MPSSYFSRDPIASIGTGVALHRMYYKPAQPRGALLQDLPSPIIPISRERRSGTTTIARLIEGGDVSQHQQTTLAVGISERTEAAAIDTLAHNLFWGEEPSAVIRCTP